MLGEQGACRCAGVYKCVLGKKELVAVLAVCSCVLGKRELVAVLAVCSCLLWEAGPGRCAGSLLVCARVRGSWSIC